MHRNVKSKAFAPFWKTMYLVALAYPEKPTRHDKKRYRTFYNSFIEVLPCKVCKKYTKTVIKKNCPLDYTSRDTLMRGIYAWKVAVTAKLRRQGIPVKPEKPYTTVRKKYLGLVASKCAATCS